MTIQTYKMGPGTLKLNAPRTVADVTTVNASAAITSAAPAFISGDVGTPISGAGIPVGATIIAVTSPYAATLSANATAGATVPVTITPAALKDASCQVKSCEVEATENVTAEEAVDALCGEQLPAEEEVTLTWRIKASLLADISVGGLTDFSFTNRKKVVWAEFIPNTALGRKVSGPVRIVPLKVGGVAKKRAEHDIDWAMPTVEPTWV